MSVLFTAGTDYENGINMHNANAGTVLDALGYDTTYMGGTATATDFLGRVLVALAVAPEDAGRPDMRDGNWIYGGRQAGYLQGRLEELRAFAENARKRGQDITWG